MKEVPSRTSVQGGVKPNVFAAASSTLSLTLGAANAEGDLAEAREGGSPGAALPLHAQPFCFSSGPRLACQASHPRSAFTQPIPQSSGSWHPPASSRSSTAQHHHGERLLQARCAELLRSRRSARGRWSPFGMQDIAQQTLAMARHLGGTRGAVDLRVLHRRACNLF